ncbi:integrase [Micromonospora sp. NPDC048898]|uniref:integrase n=1 Tax=Micromonospora sp. NPDC048898 TaxID=3364260 RepID=UPI00371D639B
MNRTTPTDEYDRHVLARMTDFFTLDGLPWPRRLWDIGSLLALEELHEAGAWERQHVLSTAAVDWQRGELSRIIGPDVGLGAKDLRREVTVLLKSPLPDPSPARRRLLELIHHARPGYMGRWASAAALPEADRPRPERLARMVASHLLDLGYDATYLLDWAEGLSRRDASATDVLDAAVALDEAPTKDFAVLAAFASSPEQTIAQKQSAWLGAREVSAWLTARGHSPAGLRGGGGFLFCVVARDPYGAAARVRLLLDRLVARSSYLRSARDGIKPHERMWVDGHPTPVPIASPARGADLVSLVKEEHLYQVDGTRSLIDDALELAAPINRGAVGPAVAGAWAAVESLLSHPDDPRPEGAGKAVAADRLAAIIACAWPRAELTALAHHHRPVPLDALAQEIKSCTTNRDRSHLVAAALAGGHSLVFAKKKAQAARVDSDRAAMERMRAVLAEPRRSLAEATKTFTIAMRRLYRMRNIVLHGGSTQSVAMDAALRIAAPLLGAGLDRLTHGLLTEDIEPLALAARAEIALQLVGGETGLSVVDLLGPRPSPARTSP